MAAEFSFKLAIFSLLLHLTIANKYYYYDYQGPFCATRRSNGRDSCCNDRQDECSVPISSKYLEINILKKLTTCNLLKTFPQG